MWKKTLPLMLAPCLLVGCASTFTNLSAKHQIRNPNNLYPVEVALNTRQQSLRWDSIRAFVVVEDQPYEMRQTLRMKNRWEGLVPVPPRTNAVSYHYKFDFQYNAFGPPKADSDSSPEYKLLILDK